MGAVIRAAVGRTAFVSRALVVLRGVFRNPELRRVELAYAGFNAAEWGSGSRCSSTPTSAARDDGRARAVAQLVPAGLFAPSPGARRPAPARPVSRSAIGAGAGDGGTAVALLAGGPPLVAYALAAVAATAVTITRPTQAALVPALARMPDELTATNVVSGWAIKNVSVLAAPALAGVLLAVASPGWVFAVMALVAGVSALLVARVRGPSPAPRRAARAGGDAGRLPGARARALGTRAGRPPRRPVRRDRRARRALRRARDLRARPRRLGRGLPERRLRRRRRGGNRGHGRAGRAAPAVAAARPWAFSSGARPSWCSRPGRPSVGALLLLAAAGAARSLLDVAGRTLLQRTAPTDVLSRVFGVLEGLSMACLAIGSLLTPALVALAGPRWAIAGIGALLPVSGGSLRAHAGRDRRVARRCPSSRSRCSARCRCSPLWGPRTGGPRARAQRDARAGRHDGGQGGRAGRPLLRRRRRRARGRVRGPGAEAPDARRRLRRDRAAARRSRTATVTAHTDSRLYALGKARFLASVGSHPRAAREADRLVDERLPSQRATTAL